MIAIIAVLPFLGLVQSSDNWCLNINKTCDCLKSQISCPKITTESYTGVIIKHNHSAKRLNIHIRCENTSLLDLPTVPQLGSNATELIIDKCPVETNLANTLQEKVSLTSGLVQSLEFRNLHSASFKREHLEAFTSLTALSLKSDYERLAFEANVFQSDTMEELMIDANCSRGGLPQNVFGTESKLQWLRLSHCLHHISPGLFHNLLHLKKLELTNNRLVHLHEWDFRLPNLTYLDLTHNDIATVDGHCFYHLPKLEELDLKYNPIMILPLPHTLFQGNPRLKTVNLVYNRGVVLDDGILSNLPALKQVKINSCQLVRISGKVGDSMTSLEILELNRNNLSWIPPDLFENVPNLRHLDLSRNKIKDIPDLGNLVQLRYVNLDMNLISTVDNKTLSNLKELTQLYLQHNQIRVIDKNAFYHNSKLQVIDLGYNLFSIGNDYVNELLGHTDLREIRLNNNLIQQVLALDKFTVFKNLLKVDLRWNQIRHVTLDKNFLEQPRNFTIYLEGNHLRCDCQNYELITYIRSQANTVLKNVDETKCHNQELPYRLKTVPLSLLLCPLERCADTCDCYRRPSNNAIIVDCSHRNLTQVPKLTLPKNLETKLVEVTLQGNKLVGGPDASYQLVTTLVLDDNEIEGLNWIPPKLQNLSLSNNKLKTMDSRVLEALNLSQLFLGGNPWSCDCETSSLATFITGHHNIVNKSDILCQDKRRLIDLNAQTLCHSDLLRNLALTLGLLALLVTALVLLYYYYERDLKAWLFAHNLLLWWVVDKEEFEGSSDKIYDIFLSYSPNDQDFIEDNLISVLQAGNSPYKLCIDIQNWSVDDGFIIQQIRDSVAKSRRTLIVISPHFLEDNGWGPVEFRTAHTHSMDEGKCRLIVVLLGNVDLNALDKDIRSYLKTTTYVKWGDPYFWNKLRYALPHNVARNKMYQRGERIQM